MILPSKHKAAALLVNCVWLLAILISYLVAVLGFGEDAKSLLPALCAALFPALFTLALLPAIRREWAQLIIILLWTALAVFACVAAGIWPMGILFLCAPVAGAMFGRTKFLEAIVISAICALIFFLARNLSFFDRDVATVGQTAWGYGAALFGTITFALAGLFAGADAIMQADPGPNLSSRVDTPETKNMLGGMQGDMLLIGKDGTLDFISAGAVDTFGLPSVTDDLTVLNVFAGNNKLQEDVFALLGSANEDQTGELHYTMITLPAGDNDGETGRVIELAAALRPCGEILLHGVDITQYAGRIQALEAEHQVFRRTMEEKSLFFSGVSHELRTPLNAIIGFSDMMRSRLFGPLPNKYAEYADLIHDSGQHMLDLIGDVLDMSKVEAGKYELHYDTFDIADVIGSTVKMVRPTADAAEVMLKTDIANNQDILVEADRKAIRQILLNLMSNSIKFTPKGGLVYISAKVVRDTLHLMVSDNGAGMNKDELARVGEPFVQASGGQKSEHRGSGLGLSLVKSLTNLHGGRFAIASQTGVGTSVDIYIPLHRR